ITIFACTEGMGNLIDSKCIDTNVIYIMTSTKRTMEQEAFQLGENLLKHSPVGYNVCKIVETNKHQIVNLY
ncbi:hypothetical protein ACJX0J_020044, partial [Zea mays]